MIVIGLHAGACDHFHESCVGPETGRDLPPVVSRYPDCVVRCDGTDVIALPGDNGTILGTAFSEGRLIRSGDEISRGRAIVFSESEGRAIVDRLWGHYIAILPAPRGRGNLLLRSPMGALGCYFVLRESCLLASNDPALLQQAMAVKLEVDWVGVAAHLLVAPVRPDQTALAGVTELTGGDMLRAGKGEFSRHHVWSPWQFATRDQEPSNAESDHLRSVISESIQCQASRFDNILLTLSGGLDSSIVAASLKAAKSNFSAVTFTTTDASGDEHFYAEQVCTHLETRLYKRHRNVDGVDVSKSHASHLPRPLARSFSQESSRIMSTLARELGVDAFFGGGAGDNVFGYQTSVAPLVDRVRREGLRAGAQTASDLAAMTQVSVPAIWRKAVARLIGRRNSFRLPFNAALLMPDVVADGIERCKHDWLEPHATALPGQAGQVALLHFALNYLEGFDHERAMPNVFPLLSQPIVELCLSIPSWAWFGGGWNRVPARHAFRDQLPSDIIWRQSKGMPDSFAVEIFERYFETMRDMLLNGHLAREQIVVRSEVESAFRRCRIPRGSEFWRLMALVDVEAWLGDRMLR
nr:asparagine synthase C-terminal domain-containing protein [Sphingomonas chungangi]